MSLAIKKSDLAGEFSSRVEAESHARLTACVQCKKCSAGCPLRELADLKPHEVVRLVQLGQVTEVLSSRTIWGCTSCHTCSTRCPQRVDICAMNDTLRRMSRDQARVQSDNKQPVFNDSFLASIKQRGRIYEVGLMATYKLRTLRLFEDMDKLPTMLKKRKLRLLPTSVSGVAERRRIWKRVSTMKGKQP